MRSRRLDAQTNPYNDSNEAESCNAADSDTDSVGWLNFKANRGISPGAWTTEASDGCLKDNITEDIDGDLRAAIVEELEGYDLQDLFERCTVGVTVVDPANDDMLLIASDGFAEITGFSQFELGGASPRCLDAPEHMDTESLMALSSVAAPNGAPTTVMLVQRRKAGELFLQLVDMQRLTIATCVKDSYDDHGHMEELQLLVGIHMDVTDIADEVQHDLTCAKFREIAEAVREKKVHQLANLAVQSFFEGGFDANLGKEWELLPQPRWC